MCGNLSLMKSEFAVSYVLLCAWKFSLLLRCFSHIIGYCKSSLFEKGK